MSFFRPKAKLHPLFALLGAVFFIVFALVMARDIKCSYFLLGAYVWLFLFGCYKGCLKALPCFIVFGGAFALVAYFAYGRSMDAAMAMANRFGGVFLAVAVGMSIESVRTVRCLSQLKAPRSVTLGMLIATSFLPLLRLEIKRVREAMRTRGASSIANPKIFYRAFLVPFITRLVNISDTLSLSVETRGYALGKVPYTVYKKERVVITDVLFILGLAGGAVMAVLL